MKMLFKQRLFSWFDSYDIYDEMGNTIFTVEGKLSWGHCLHIQNANGQHIGTVQEKVLTIAPKFELYAYGDYLGTLKKEITLFTPRFVFDRSDWQVEGDWAEWNYTITSPSQGLVAVIGKNLFRWTDTYVIDVCDPDNALCALMVVLAIDAEKCRG